jgi:HAD superfamily hydrolase (TIGR01490 family)
MSGAAFFDLDNTFIKGSVLFHAGAGMVRHGLVTRREIARYAGQHVAFRWRGEHVGELAGVRERALMIGAGLHVAEVVALGEQVYDERLAERIWDGTRRLAERHLELGDPVWLVTGAPVELAEIVARRLGLSGALGTVSDVEDGKWTGRLVGEILHGQAKAAAVGALAEREGLDLDECAAYSDSRNDLPLLEMVAFPHAVNPDRQLRRIAVQRRWPVHDFRTRRQVMRVAAPAAVATIVTVTPFLWPSTSRHAKRAIAHLTRRDGSRAERRPA